LEVEAVELQAVVLPHLLEHHRQRRLLRESKLNRQLWSSISTLAVL
jgi:hypothetical protein